MENRCGPSILPWKKHEKQVAHNEVFFGGMVGWILVEYVDGRFELFHVEDRTSNCRKDLPLRPKFLKFYPAS